MATTAKSKSKTTEKTTMPPDASPTAAPPPAAKKTDDAEDVPVRAKKEEMVSATVPRGFNLTLDDGSVKRYEPGVQDMPKSHAKHWYAKAHDVEINE